MRRAGPRRMLDGVPLAWSTALAVIAAIGTLRAQVTVTGLVDRPILMSASHSAANPSTANHTVQPPIPFSEQVPLSVSWSAPGSIGGGASVTGTIARAGAEDVTTTLHLGAGSRNVSLPVSSSGTIDGSVLLSFSASTLVEGAFVLRGDDFGGQGLAQMNLYVDVLDDQVQEVTHGSSYPSQTPPFAWSTHLQLTPTPVPVRVRVVAWGGDGAGAGYNLTLHFAPSLLGTWHTIGTGCGAPGFAIPRLDATGVPRRGTGFTVRIDQLPNNPLNVAMLLLGFSDQFSLGRPLPADLGIFGMPGCTQYIDPTPWAALLPNQGGAASMVLPMPAHFLAGEIGVTFFFQGVVLAPGINAFGGLVTNAGAGVIGW